MQLRTKLEIIAGAVLFVLIALFAWQWHEKAVDNAKAEAKAEADRQATSKIDDTLKARDAQYQAQLKDIEARYQALARMTPTQIVEKVPQYIPQAPEPVKIVTVDSPKPQVGDAIVPKADIQPIAQAILDGQKCKVDLGKCSADLGDWQQKFQLAQDQSAQWQKAAKGGSVIKRVGKIVLYVSIGAAAGYAAHR